MSDTLATYPYVVARLDCTLYGRRGAIDWCGSPTNSAPIARWNCSNCWPVTAIQGSTAPSDPVRPRQLYNVIRERGRKTTTVRPNVQTPHARFFSRSWSAPGTPARFFWRPRERRPWPRRQKRGQETSKTGDAWLLRYGSSRRSV